MRNRSDIVPETMDFSDSGFQDQSNKAGLSSIKSNVTENYNDGNIAKPIGSKIDLSSTSQACIDLTENSTDSSDEDDSYKSTVWDISDMETFSPSPLTTSPSYNGEASCVVSDNLEILEENNNDPNNNLGYIEIPQESSNGAYIEEVAKDRTHKTDGSRELRSPVPGCSKDMSTIDDSKDITLCYKALKEATLMSMLLPDIEFGLIVRTLKKYQYAKNYIELTLWDLLPDKKPVPQVLSKRRITDDICIIERKKPVSKKVGITYNEMQTSDTEISEISCAGTPKDKYFERVHGLLHRKYASDKCLCVRFLESKNTNSEVQEKKIVSDTDGKTVNTQNPIIRPAKLVVSTNVCPLQTRLLPSTNNVVLAPPKLNYVSKYLMDVIDNDKSLSPVKNTVPTQSTNETKTEDSDIRDKFQQNIFSNKVETQSCSSDQVSSLPLDVKNADASNGNEIFPSCSNISKESDLNFPSTSKDIVVSYSGNLQEDVSAKNRTIAGTSGSELMRQEASITWDMKLSPKMWSIYYKLLPIFPYVNPDYIKSICTVHDAEKENFDETTELHILIEHLLAVGDEHPSVIDIESESAEAINVKEQYENILGIFPDADPDYLRYVIEGIYTQPEAVKAFVQSKLEKPDYPTREQYLVKKKITEQQKQYTSEFRVKQFLEIFPDPFAYFENPQRKFQFNQVVFDFLQHYYNNLRISTLMRVYKENNYHLTLTANALDKVKPDMKENRLSNYLPAKDVSLLQEIAFVQHRTLIQAYLIVLKKTEAVEFQRLKDKNDLVECQCCFNDECMPSKCSSCDNGHTFCNACIIKGAELKLSESETHIRCFVNCTSEFSLAILQKVLSPTTFSILLRKRQEAEIMAAGLEGLISCPFCHFASIPPPEDKVFKCFNPECMKETCRSCKELNHVPLSCDEAKSEKARHYLEEKMTQALIHNCYNCNRSFFKEEGCNKMICVCGAQMCYICDKPVCGYEHFRGQGSLDMNLCPLWSNSA